MKKLTKEEIIKRAKSVHGDKYDYSKVELIDVRTKICIICPIHGEFKQSPDNHLSGKGCPKCKETSLERYTRNILEENKIEYVYQKRFSWLGKQSLDFYLPKQNIAIECQGEQHYHPVDFGGKGKKWAKTKFKQVQKLDKTKFKKVTEKNIDILYIDGKNKNDFSKKIKEWVK